MTNKILILSASAGAGHLRAAQALEKALIERDPSLEVFHLDTLDYTNKLFRRLYGRIYMELVNRSPQAYGWLYNHLDKPWQYRRRRLALDKLNARPFIKVMETLQPDLVICTHFLPSEIIAWLRENHRLRTRQQALVITDFDLHALWLTGHVDHYFVALEETRVHLEALGIPGDSITVSGIPVDPVFARHRDKTQSRLDLKLDRDLPTLLVTAGGLGMGPVGLILQSLDQVRTPSQAVVICGKGQELKHRVDQHLRQRPHNGPVRITSVGYTGDMDLYMSAADLLLGKTGGLTTSEALTKGLAFVIVDPIEGQEERNADHLLEEGAAIRCNNLPALGYKVDRLLGDPKRLKVMQHKSLRLARPKAAFTIVDKLLSSLF